MKQLTKYQLAELIIYSDIMDDILSEYDFNQNMKFEFNKIQKSVKKLIKYAFGANDLEEFDEFKHSVRNFTNDIIKNKVELKQLTK